MGFEGAGVGSLLAFPWESEGKREKRRRLREDRFVEFLKDFVENLRGFVGSLHFPLQNTFERPDERTWF